MSNTTQIPNPEQNPRRRFFKRAAIAEAADVLTPAQRKELAAHFVRRHERWGHG